MGELRDPDAFPSLCCDVQFKFRNLAELAGIAFSKLLKSDQTQRDWGRREEVKKLTRSGAQREPGLLGTSKVVSSGAALSSGPAPSHPLRSGPRPGPCCHHFGQTIWAGRCSPARILSASASLPCPRLSGGGAPTACGLTYQE